MSEPDVSAILPGVTLDWTATRGAMGYRQGKACGHIRMFWDGSDGMGVHLCLSGQACRELEGHWLAVGRPSLGRSEATRAFDWLGYLAYLTAFGASVTRIDLALDDRHGYLDVGTMSGAVRAGSVTTRWRSWREYESGAVGEQGSGRTLYLGSGQSNSQLRVYDKAAEQNVTGHWVRCELECRDDRAQAAVVLLLAQGSLAAIAGMLRGLIEFRDASTSDSNDRRWQIASWWDAFLGAVSRLKLATAPRCRTLEQVRDWFRVQVAPTLAMLLQADAGDLGWLLDTARDGQRRLTGRHQAMLSGYAA